MNSTSYLIDFDTLLHSIEISDQLAVLASSGFVLNSATPIEQRTQVIAALLRSETVPLCIEGIRCSSSTLVAGLPIDLQSAIGLIGELFDRNENVEQYCADFFSDLNANLATFSEDELQGRFSRELVRNRGIRLLKEPKLLYLERVLIELKSDLVCGSVCTRLLAILGMSHFLSKALTPKVAYELCGQNIRDCLDIADQDSHQSLRNAADTARFFWELQ